MWKSIVCRFTNLFKSKALSALDAIENPVEMYELAVHESEENIRNMTKAIALALADQKSKEKELHQARLEAESWQAKAKTALLQGHHELAKTALEHKTICAKKAEEYGALTEMMKIKIEEQKKNLNRIKMKHEELKAKRSIYLAKYETAKAQKQVAESIGGINNTALSGISRIEEKINKLEAESEAMLELTQGEQTMNTLFNELETSMQVEQELEMMKAQMRLEFEIEQRKNQSRAVSNNASSAIEKFYTDNNTGEKSNTSKDEVVNSFFNKKLNK